MLYDERDKVVDRIEFQPLFFERRKEIGRVRARGERESSCRERKKVTQKGHYDEEEVRPCREKSKAGLLYQRPVELI